MKNSEWGAVAYLSISDYGKNDEGWINPADTYFTGCSGTTASSSTTVGCINTYNTNTNQQSSTTGNVYGVYDMSGGAYDVVAAYYDNGHDNLRQNGLSIYNAHPKYKDVYTMGSSDTQANNYTKAINKKGDAVYETSSTATGSTSWYSDRSNTPYTSAPWFIRSGIYSNTSGAGIFYFSYTAGAPNDGVGFRPVLLVGEGL
jgi:hypothetical protein